MFESAGRSVAEMVAMRMLVLVTLACEPAAAQPWAAQPWAAQPWPMEPWAAQPADLFAKQAASRELWLPSGARSSLLFLQSKMWEESHAAAVRATDFASAPAVDVTAKALAIRPVAVEPMAVSLPCPLQACTKGSSCGKASGKAASTSPSKTSASSTSPGKSIAKSEGFSVCVCGKAISRYSSPPPWSLGPPPPG